MIRLMSILSMLVIVLQVFSAGPRELQEQDKWIVAFYDEQSKLGEITVEAGRYYDLTVKVLNNELKTIPNDTTVLKLPGDAKVKTPLEKYFIDTLHNLEYKILIGVPCATADGVYEVQFEQVDSTKKFTVNSLKVNVKTVSPAEIALKNPLPAIPAGSFSLVEIILPRKNVDALNIKWVADASNHKSAKMDDIDFHPFKGIDEWYYTSVLIGVYEAEKATQIFTANINNKCYVLKSPLQVTATNEKLPVFTKEAILTNSTIDTPVDNNSIKVSINIPQAPAMLSCVLVCTFSDFPKDEHIRKQDDNISEPLAKKFYQALIPKPEIHVITWREASRVGSYKMKCLVDTTAIKDDFKNSVSFIFGKDEKSSLSLPLITTRDPPTPAHCAKWTFKTDIDMGVFVPTMTTYCESIFAGWDKKGCLKCIPKFVEDVDMCPRQPKNKKEEKSNKSLAICVRSYPSCTSVYPNFPEAFGKFVDGLTKEEDIRKNLVLGDKFVLGLESITTESDTVSPDPKGITATPTKVKDENIHFQVQSTLDKDDVECNYKITSIPVDKLTIDDIDDDVIVLKKNDTSKDIPYHFKDKNRSEKKEYNIIMSCFHIPNVPYHYLYSPIFVAGTFNRTDDCKDKKKNPECREKKPHKNPEMKGNDPKKDNSKKIDEYSKLEKEAKKLLLEEIKNAIKAAKARREILDQAILLNEMIAVEDCKDADNFTDCSEIKKINQGQAVKKINEIVQCGKMNETLQATEGTTVDEDIKLALISLLDISNNTDSINKETSDTLNTMVACLAKDAPILIKMLEASVKEKLPETKLDVANFLIALTSNMLDVSKNDEMDGFLEIKPNSKSALIIHKKTKELKAAIEANSALLLKYTEEPVKMENLMFYKKKMVQTTPKRHLEAPTYEDLPLEDESFKITVSIPTNYILSSVNKNITNTGALYYTKYPLLSVDNTQFSEPVVGLKMYDQNNVEVPITKLDYPILVTIPQKDPSFKYCVFYNEAKADWDSLGVETDLTVPNFVTCKLYHLTDVTIGAIAYVPEQETSGMPGWGIAVIIIGCALAIGIIVLALIFCCKSKPSPDILVNEGNTRDIQMRKI